MKNVFGAIHANKCIRKKVNAITTNIKLSCTKLLTSLIIEKIEIIINITVNKNDNNTVFIGNIKNLGSSKYSIKIKLYDKDGKVIRETSQEYNTENRFEITFDYNDSLNKDSIVRYSISINR